MCTPLNIITDRTETSRADILAFLCLWFQDTWLLSWMIILFRFEGRVVFLSCWMVYTPYRILKQAYFINGVTAQLTDCKIRLFCQMELFSLTAVWVLMCSEIKEAGRCVGISVGTKHSLSRTTHFIIWNREFLCMLVSRVKVVAKWTPALQDRVFGAFLFFLLISH